jgi:outer membrane usher protein
VRASSSSWRGLATALLLGAACAALAQSPREAWYQAVVDHVDSGLTVLVLRRDDGETAVRQIDLALLEIAVPAVAGRRHEGEMFYPISSLPGYDISFDDAQGRMYLRSSAGARAAATPRVPIVDVPVPVPAAPQAAEETGEEWLVDVVVNGQPVEGNFLLRRAPAGWMLDARLLPAAGLLARDAGEWIALSALVDDNFVLDRSALRLELSVPTDRFAGTDLSLDAMPVTSIDHQPSAVLGYDLATGIDDDGRQWSSALLDLGAARGDISCRSVQAWRSIESRLDRLETACVYDWPERLLSLRVGDSITRSGAFGQAVRYGGVRIGTDYDLAPYLQTLPALSVEGSARLPSLLEVYIDQRLALRTDVPPGPFDIRDIPTTTGNGEVRTVVTDALGRQTIVTSPFYSDPMLLRPGLLDWSAELGRVRTGFLGPDDSYGDGFAAFSARRGMSDALTLELRGETRDAAAMLGITATVRLGAAGVAEIGVAEGRDDASSGRAFLLGYSYRGRDWSVGLRRWRSDDGYRALGYERAGDAPEEFSQAHVGLRFARASLSFAAVLRERRDGERDRFASASLSVPLWRGSLLNLSVMQGLDEEGETTFGLTWSVPLGSARSAYLAVQEQPGAGTVVQAGLQRSPPLGRGTGYRLQASQGDGIDALSAQGVLRGETGELELAVSSSNGSRAADARWSGSVIANRDGVFPARNDPGAYASVDVGAPGVRVYRDQQPVATSRADGIALVPGLRPFERNRLQVSTQDLPMDRQIVSNEITLVPGRDQALAVAFELREAHAISGELRRDDGSLVPPGAELTLASDGSSLGPVGFDGLVFIELRARSASRIDVRWPSNHCTLELGLAHFDADPQQSQALTCRTE